VALVENARIAMDVDDAGDLRALLAHAPGGATGAWLAARPGLLAALARLG
jgi:2-phospho-L-lactate guanylyltransferase (CobY/MobA/RfbA family)